MTAFLESGQGQHNEAGSHRISVRAFVGESKKQTVMKAKIKANQSNLNKAVNWLAKYNSFNNERDLIEGNLEVETYDSKEWRRINKKCEDSFEKYEEYCDELPKYEVVKIEKSELY